MSQEVLLSYPLIHITEAISRSDSIHLFCFILVDISRSKNMILLEQFFHEIRSMFLRIISELKYPHMYYWAITRSCIALLLVLLGCNSTSSFVVRGEAPVACPIVGNYMPSNFISARGPLLCRRGLHRERWSLAACPTLGA